MTELNKMYEGVANSPDTFLTQPIASGGTIMYVADVSVFGTLPNLAVIGNGANAETILIKKKREDGGLDVERGIEGKAKDWPKATTAARNFTNYDHGKFKENIEILNKDKLEENSQIAFTEANKKENIFGTDSIKIIFSKLSKWFISLKDIAWTGKLADAEEDETHRLVTDSEKEKWNKELEKASQSEAETATDDTKYMTPLRTKDAIEKLSTKVTKLSELEEDETHRLVTDVEKEKWNKKADKDTVTTINGKTGAITKEDIVALGIPSKDTNTTYSDATTSKSGLMSASDKKKLNGINSLEIQEYTPPTSDDSSFYSIEGQYKVIKIKDVAFFCTHGYSRVNKWERLPERFRPKKDVDFQVYGFLERGRTPEGIGVVRIQRDGRFDDGGYGLQPEATVLAYNTN